VINSKIVARVVVHII